MTRRAADVALIDPDARHARGLARGLREAGLRAAWFADRDALLLSREPYAFRFFVVDATQDPDGRFIRLLRRRSEGGVLAFGALDLPTLFRTALSAGADMVLPRPLAAEDVVLAVQALRRRLESAPAHQAWRLHLRDRRLLAPGGQVATLTSSDAQALACFAGAEGALVTRDTLARVLGVAAGPGADNLIHAAIYRLRRRVQQATAASLPVRSVAGEGYVFRGRLASQ